MKENDQDLSLQTDLAELDLAIDDLEDRFAPDVHGACVCSCTCDCTSCSCVAWAS
jgi:hypothetical protein